MKYYVSFLAILEKEWIEVKRYWFNSLIGLVLYLVVFAALFSGAQYIGAENRALSESLEGFLVGYALWFIAMSAFSDTAYSIVDEARKGTLEQLYMTEIPFVWLLISKNIVSTLYSIIMFFIIVLFQMLITGIRLNLDFISIFIILLIGLFSLYGIGLILAGIGLIFKKIQNMLGAAQFVIVGLMMLSPANMPLLQYFPFVYTRQLIMDILRSGKGLLNFSIKQYIALIGISLFYMTLGIYGYRLAERQVLKNGMLGQY